MLESQDEFRALFESAPDLMYTQDLAGTLTRVNKAFERVSGYTRSEALQLRFIDIVVPHQREFVQERVAEQIGGGTPKPFEVEIITRDNSRVFLEVSTQLIFRKGTPAGIQGYARDISEKRRNLAEKALTEAQLVVKTDELARFTRHLQLLHRLSTTNYAQLDELFRDYLVTGCEIFGATHGAITTVDSDHLITRKTHHATNRGFADAFAKQIVRDRRTFTSADENSSTFYVGTPILTDGEFYGVVGFWSDDEGANRSLQPQSREIVELMAKSIGIAIHHRSLTDQLAYQAKHDSLTGLPNRSLLRERLDNALKLAQQTGSLVAVVFIDLDRFKQINDTLGHGTGDRVLQQLAHRLETCLPLGSTLARMGGDEFTAILTGIRAPSEALIHVRRLLGAMRSPCRIDHYELFVTGSIGVSYYPGDGHDGATLLRNSDIAMYAAKARGKNDFECFTAEASQATRSRLELENSLRRAIERGELQLFFQPQVELSGRIAGLEALLVWDHPELGRIPPAKFIPIAEETGMILAIGAWVLREACNQMAAWMADGHQPVTVAVNVSALQLAQVSFVEMVADILQATALPPALLELELTESLIMRDVDQSAALMRRLREIGVKIAIDDFGTGYSSLGYLRKLPADSLKIDQSFLQEPEFGDAAVALIKTIVILGHTLGLNVTAEGVETVRQLEMIKEAGCDRAQGHLFGGPLEPDIARKLLESTVAVEVQGS